MHIIYRSMDNNERTYEVAFRLNHFLPRVIIYIFPHFGSFMVVWGWSLELGGWGIQLMGFWACRMRISGVFGVGAAFKKKSRCMSILNDLLVEQAYTSS